MFWVKSQDSREVFCQISGSPRVYLPPSPATRRSMAEESDTRTAFREASRTDDAKLIARSHLDQTELCFSASSAQHTIEAATQESCRAHPQTLTMPGRIVGELVAPDRITAGVSTPVGNSAAVLDALIRGNQPSSNVPGRNPRPFTVEPPKSERILLLGTGALASGSSPTTSSHQTAKTSTDNAGRPPDARRSIRQTGVLEEEAGPFFCDDCHTQ